MDLAALGLFCRLCRHLAPKAGTTQRAAQDRAAVSFCTGSQAPARGDSAHRSASAVALAIASAGDGEAQGA
eukprot:6230623-Amphidinium_carterae.1